MSLSVEQRAVVELTFYHGYTYREIATIVDCPVDTVKTRMFHARRRLKALLAEHREEAA
jgi:RNA polymerase sigma factor (sigma-70 family)